MTIAIPESHMNLIAGPYAVVLTTVMPDGQPQSTVVPADRLTRLYTGKQSFYGDIYPAEQQHQVTRVVCRIKPTKCTVDAIFK